MPVEQPVMRTARETLSAICRVLSIRRLLGAAGCALRDQQQLAGGLAAFECLVCLGGFTKRKPRANADVERTGRDGIHHGRRTQLEFLAGRSVMSERGTREEERATLVQQL